MKAITFQNNERGIVLPLLGIVVVGLLMVVGLALDGGRVFQVEEQLTSAARAGVTAGLAYRIDQGWTAIHGAPSPSPTAPGVNDAVVRVRAIEAAKQTLLTNRINSGTTYTNDNATNTTVLTSGGATQAQITAIYSSVTDLLRVDIRFDNSVFLMGRLPGFLGSLCPVGAAAGTCRINVTAQGQLDPINVALVLDKSGSMSCPRNDPAANNAARCACRTTGTCPGAPNRKIDALIDTIDGSITGFTPDVLPNDSFKAKFNPTRDRISVIPFNIAGNLAFSVRTNPGTNNAVRAFNADATATTAFSTALTSLATPKSNSNPCSGLRLALEDFEAATDGGAPLLGGNQRAAVVLVTDGAPTAGDFFFQDTADATKFSSLWSNYVVEWTDPNLAPPNNRWTFPSQLVKTSAISIDGAGGDPSAASPGMGIGGANLCGTLVNQNQASKIREAYGIPSGGGASTCINSWAFKPRANVTPLPPTAASGAMSAGDGTISGSQDWDSWRRIYYWCVTEMTDELRRKGVNVYTLGIGPLPPTTVASTDPYQDSNDDFSRKPLVMDRWAYNYFKWDNATTKPPQQAYTNYQTYSNLYSTFSTSSPVTGMSAPDFEGVAYGTDNVNELPALFRQIANEILRMTG